MDCLSVIKGHLINDYGIKVKEGTSYALGNEVPTLFFNVEIIPNGRHPNVEFKIVDKGEGFIVYAKHLRMTKQEFSLMSDVMLYLNRRISEAKTKAASVKKMRDAVNATIKQADAEIESLAEAEGIDLNKDQLGHYVNVPELSIEGVPARFGVYLDNGKLMTNLKIGNRKVYLELKKALEIVKLLESDNFSYTA